MSQIWEREPDGMGFSHPICRPICGKGDESNMPHSAVGLKRLLWRDTKKPTMMRNGSLRRLQWWMMCHYKGHSDVSLQRLLWQMWLNMHLNRVFLQLPVAMSLYKDMSSCNISSHFTHTLSFHTHTTFLIMSHYLIPAWNEHPFCRCSLRAMLCTSLVPTTYGRRYWVCPDTVTNGDISFSI
jgi:hypothetical protein